MTSGIIGSVLLLGPTESVVFFLHNKEYTDQCYDPLRPEYKNRPIVSNYSRKYSRLYIVFDSTALNTM